MSRLNNLSQGNLGDILRRIARLEMGTPLASSSMGRGRLRLYDGSVLLIENGALQVTGTATVSGTMKVTGTMDVTGPTNLKGKVSIEGDTTISGKIDVTGPMATKGTLSVEGVTTLRNDLNVTSGGKINVGSNMTLTPSVGGGSAQFPNGSMEGTPNGVQLANTARTRYVYASSDQAGITAGSNAFVASGGGSYVLGLTTTGNAANVYIDANGKLWRTN